MLTLGYTDLFHNSEKEWEWETIKNHDKMLAALLVSFIPNNHVVIVCILLYSHQYFFFFYVKQPFQFSYETLASHQTFAQVLAGDLFCF